MDVNKTNLSGICTPLGILNSVVIIANWTGLCSRDTWHVKWFGVHMLHIYFWKLWKFWKARKQCTKNHGTWSYSEGEREREREREKIWPFTSGNGLQVKNRIQFRISRRSAAENFNKNFLDRGLTLLIFSCWQKEVHEKRLSSVEAFYRAIGVAGNAHYLSHEFVANTSMPMRD